MSQISGAEVRKSTIYGIKGGKALRNFLPWLSSKKDVLHLLQQ